MLLQIENLKTHYQTAKGDVKAVDGISFSIGKDEVFGLVGESGCGKSTLIRTIMRLIPDETKVEADKLLLNGSELLPLSDKEYRKSILWKEISLVPQSAMNSLNPVYKVGSQIAEIILTHTDSTKADAMDKVKDLFEAVGLQAGLVNSFAHEFSGGMRQRAMIAMSLALNPSLIIMDEPTTGLDVLVQERILRKLVEIKAEMKKETSILLITHDISVVAEMSDRIGVMYAGQLMEVAPTKDLFANPYHPYSLGLKNAFPSIKDLDRELISIPGSPPDLMGDERGCIFRDRCPFRIDECNEKRPEFKEIKPDHYVACLRTNDVNEFRQLAGEKKTWIF